MNYLHGKVMKSEIDPKQTNKKSRFALLTDLLHLTSPRFARNKSITISFQIKGQHRNKRIRHNSEDPIGHSRLRQKAQVCLQGWTRSSLQPRTSGTTRFHLMSNFTAPG